MKWRKTKQGYLVTTAQLTYVGEFEYYGYELGLTGSDINKKFNVIRTEKELFSPDTIASFEGMPLTLIHPDSQEVNAETWKSGKTIGHIQSVRRQDKYLICDAYINDAAAITTIEKLGLREVSCGYEPAELVLINGQIHHINILGNHVAVVPEGRGGATCRLNDKKGKAMGKDKFTLSSIINLLKGKKINDSEGQALTEDELKNIIATLEETLKELEGKGDEETLAKVQGITTQLSELKEQLEKMKQEGKPVNDSDSDSDDNAKVTELQAENEQLKAKIKELEEKLAKLEGDSALSSTLNDAKARFPKLKFNDAKSTRDVQESVLVGIGAFNDSSVKALTNEQVQAAYAAAQVSAKRPESKIGAALLSDSKSKDKPNLTKQFGGK